MAISHAAHLHNNIPHISNVKSPKEFLTTSNSSHISIHNSRPRGCPICVLEPILQDGNKFPKWMPKSSIYRYWGVSPIHASTVGMVSNIHTGNISPQLHLVFDDYFETVHKGEDK